MTKKHFLMMIALMCTMVQGAWAQTEVSTEDALKDAVKTDGASVMLTADIALSEKLTIGSGKTVTIDLNGKKLSRNLSANENYGMVIYVNGGNLTIKDGSGDNSGQITGGRSYNGAGVLCESGSTLTINGGTFKKNDVSRHEGSHGRGGAIFMNPNTTLTITGGVFDNNSAYHGGAIYVDDGGPDSGTPAEATISGAEFKNCWVTGDGGAIYAKGTLTISGCTISGNTASSNGGGIYIYDGTLNMQDKVIVNNNTVDGNPNNLYLPGEDKFNFTGALDQDSRIGISVEKYERKISSGYNTYHQLPANAYFFSDVDDEYVTMSVIEGEIFPKIVDGSNAAIYVERSWTGGNTDGHVVSTPKVATGVSSYSNTEDLYDGWYLLSGSETYSTRPRCHGDVKFILQDGCNVEFENGIHIDKDKKLTIYAQTGGTGKLSATGDDGWANHGDAAIGGNNKVCGGNLIIHGGDIYAYPYHNCAAGIGGGNGEASGMQSITIWGGTIEAKGRGNAAGIGCGDSNNTQPTITIYGGTITATGDENGPGIGGANNRGNGTIKIYGGDITATGALYAAGIGGGNGGDVDNPIYIYGGTVTAEGGQDGAGIGSGIDMSVKNPIYIYGGTVNATGGQGGAGIGSGYKGNVDASIYIYDGTVNATSGEKSSAIGTGAYLDSKGPAELNSPIYIYGGKVYAIGYDSGVGIGSSGENNSEIVIYGGYVEAKGASSFGPGIGSSNFISTGTVSIHGGTVQAIGPKYYNNSYHDAIACGTLNIDGGSVVMENTGELVRSDATVNLGDDIAVLSRYGTKVASDKRVSTIKQQDSGSVKCFVQPCDHSGATYTQKDADYHSVSCSYCLITQEEHSFDSDGKCSKCSYEQETTTISLMDGGDNTVVLAEYDGETVNVDYDRELTTGENGESVAYTVCLPYDVDVEENADEDDDDNDEPAAPRRAGDDEAVVKVFTLAAVDQANQQFIFTDAPTFIPAGTPVVVVVYKGSVSLNADAVLINATMPGLGLPVYASFADYEAQGDNYIGYWTGSYDTFRAFFEALETTEVGTYVPMYQPTDGELQPFPADKFADDFASGTPTGITTLNVERGTLNDDSWYDLQGRKIANGQKPTAKGLYIYNGKKRVRRID